MAKTNKRTGARAKAKAAPKTAAKTKKQRSIGARGRGSPATEVERQWRGYWQCRTELEEAVSAVQQAEKSLSSARDLERTRREVFERTKRALEGLLEVQPPGAGRAPRLEAGAQKPAPAPREPERKPSPAPAAKT
jgi:hypothetical protein